MITKVLFAALAVVVLAHPAIAAVGLAVVAAIAAHLPVLALAAELAVVAVLGCLIARAARRTASVPWRPALP